MEFRIAEDLFKSDQIRELSESADGLRFLKLRSLSRKAYLIELFSTASITPRSSSARDLLKEAFETEGVTDQVIHETISSIYEPERCERRSQESELVDQLYKLEVFDWGGLHQNSLESAIVNNYIKRIRNYDQLNRSIENELHHSMRGYVLCSWYNHWTSILIEDIFRDHASVLPSVGLISKIDFFFNEVPFDLKVTYLPEGYVRDCRRTAGIRPEITLLKRWARENRVPFSQGDPESRLLPDLWNKASDHPSMEGQELIGELARFRQQIIRLAESDSTQLIRWLYENQGVRRFDASNRLFVVLIDPLNFFEAWKLKRARPLLAAKITDYLDKAPSQPGQDVEFNWDGSTHKTLSDVILITKPNMRFS